MKSIELNHGQVALVSDEDYLKVSRRHWRALPRKSGGFYAVSDERTDAGNKIVYLHRFIMRAELENAPENMTPDHINGDGLDCRRENLRLANRFEQSQNRRSRRDNTTGYRGVDFHKKSRKFRAAIMVDKVRQHIGFFDNPEAASHAYEAVARDLQGQFYRKPKPTWITAASAVLSGLAMAA